MKIFGSILALIMVVASIGCQTTQGQAGGAAAPAVSSAPAASSGGMLTDADYKRMGIREMSHLR